MKAYKISICFIVLVSIFFIGVKINLFEDKVESFKENKEKKSYAYPMGSIIGVSANTDGVLVVGYEDEDTKESGEFEQGNVEIVGGLQRGDNIIKINDQQVSKPDDVKKILNKLRRDKVNVELERDGEKLKESVKTKYEDGKYKLGVWVRYKISGIGTITMYNPKNNKFYGIGHAITNSETNTLMKIKKGYIHKPESIEVVKGNKSSVGYLKGEFNRENSIGTFLNNTECGISGDLDIETDSDLELMEIGKGKDVNTGDAQIVLEDKNGESQFYDIKIESLVKSKDKDKNMVISIVDKDLIEYTGGVVRGMSGAPIIQNSKIIGAITYVFKDNPQKGYGIFIDEMLKLDK